MARGTRRLARETALKALYEGDVAHHTPPQVVERLGQEEGLGPQVLDYAQVLVAGVLEHQKEIDATLRRLAPAFPLEQVSAVDRNILRLAVFEILYYGNMPVKVAINEAVELAKTFGGETSPRFVNGVLGSVVDLTQKGESPRKEVKDWPQ